MRDYDSWLLLWNIGPSQEESMKLTKEPYLAMRKLAIRCTCILNLTLTNWATFGSDGIMRLLDLVNKNRITRTTYFVQSSHSFFFSKSQFINMPMMRMCLLLSFFCALCYNLFNYYFLFRYVIMCIHFLQQRRPAILPCLQVCINLIQLQACKASVIPHFLTHMFLL